MANSTDFIADFLTHIRNASRAKKDKVTTRSSKLALQITEILKKEGFIDSYKPFSEDNREFVRIHLKYLGGKKPVIQGIQKVSKPGRRVYFGCDEIPRVMGGLGISVVSTSKGLVIDREARQNRLGGEILCKVW